jgi:hypothetical protein
MQTTQSPFPVDELKRFYYDMMLTENYSLSAITKLKDQARHIQPDINSYYYLDRE